MGWKGAAMIKGIGPVFTSRPATDVARVGNDAGVTRTAAVGAADGATTAAPSAVQRMAAEGAPVDSARVEAIRARIAAGTYTIDPDAIARAMIAQDLGGK